MDFVDGLNVICGKNASGKTNLVESVYYCALGRSPRTNRDKELIKWESDEAYIKLTLAKRYREYMLEIYFNNKGEKKIFLDKLPITKLSDLIGIVNISYFSPDELAIIKESPVERRRFMDIAISQQKRSYFTDLLNYNRIVDQRNKLLKTYKSQSSIKEAIGVWDVQLARIGSRIINNRYIFVENLKKVAAAQHAELTGGSEQLSIAYESKIEKNTQQAMETAFFEQLQQNIDKDIQLQYTTIGAHRDDIDIKVNGIDLRKFGSQGQKRTAALALKLGELTITQEETGEKPILILDDVLSELDLSRQNSLLTMASKTQTLLTCTEYDNNAPRYIEIKDGEILQSE